MWAHNSPDVYTILVKLPHTHTHLLTPYTDDMSEWCKVQKYY